MAHEPLDPDDKLSDHELQSYVDGSTTLLDLYIMRLMARDLLSCRRAQPEPTPQPADYLRAENEQLREFARHKRNCDLSRAFVDSKVCTCGFNAALSHPAPAPQPLEYLRTALEPFAAFARASSFDKLPDDLPMTQGSRFARRQITAGDFKRALAAIEQNGGA